MKERNIDAFLVPHMDAHFSEYIAPCDERIAFISGFTGSNGICLVTQDFAGMWTDGRYYLQAEKQLDEGWEMKKIVKGETYADWVKANMTAGQTLAVFDNTYPTGSFATRKEEFAKKDVSMIAIDENLVDIVWGAEKAPMPSEKVWILNDKFTGQSV